MLYQAGSPYASKSRNQYHAQPSTPISFSFYRTSSDLSGKSEIYELQIYRQNGILSPFPIRISSYSNQALGVFIEIQENHLPSTHPNRCFVKSKRRDASAPHRCAIDPQLPAFKTYSFRNPIPISFSFLNTAHRRCSIYGPYSFLFAQLKSC